MQLLDQSQLCRHLRYTRLTFSFSKGLTAEWQDRQCGKGPLEWASDMGCIWEPSNQQQGKQITELFYSNGNQWEALWWALHLKVTFWSGFTRQLLLWYTGNSIISYFLLVPMQFAHSGSSLR